MSGLFSTLLKGLADATPAAWIELPEAYGAALWDAQERQLWRGLSHKYIKRAPKPGGGYRYWYAVATAKHDVGHEDHMVVGAAFRGEGGHWHITAAEGDKLTIRHDEPPHEVRTLTRGELSAMLREHHKDAIAAHRERAALPASVRRLAPGSEARKRAEAEHAAKVAAEREAAERAKVAVATPTPEPAAPVVQSIDGKLEQTGEHIWGSRKDLAGLRGIESSKDLENMSYADAAAIVTKTRLVEPLSLENARAVGMSPGTAYMALGLLGAIRAKPGDSKAERAAYVDEVRQVQGGIKSVRTLEDFQKLMDELRATRRRAPEWADVEAVANSNAAAARIAELRKDNPQVDYRVRYNYRTYATTIVQKAARPYDALGTRFVAFIKGTDAERAAKRQALTLDGPQAWMRGTDKAGMTPDESWRWLEASTKKDKDAVAKKAPAAKPARGETQRGWSSAKAETPNLAVRTGGREIPARADAERTKATFRLREVDYGRDGYMSQADREYHTHALEGALHDLADATGMPADQVSFNGRLGVALGARGTGAASAHYEPGRNVINITKFRGGGALAHEWGHALDDIIGRHYIPDTGKGRGNYLSHTPEHSALPQDVAEAAQGVMQAMMRHPDPERARREHAAKIAELTAEHGALVKENNDLVAQHGALRKKPATQEQMDRRIASTRERIAEWRKQAVELRKKASASTAKPGRRISPTGPDVEASNRDYWADNAEKTIAATLAAGIQTDADRTKLAELEADVERLRLPINRAADALRTMHKINPLMSDYYKRSMELGEKYWATPHEMWARAFSAHVEDKLTAGGRRNTYLVRDTTPGSAHAVAHPQGEERQRINAAFDRLMETLRRGGHLEKALRRLEATMRKATEPLTWELPATYGARLYAEQERPVRGLFGSLLKGLSHRYIKRTGTPGHYRYYYTAHAGGGVDHEQHLVVGSKLRHEGGHLEVTHDHGDGRVTVTHDETGHAETLHKRELAEKLRSHHREALDRHAREKALPARVRRLAPGSEARAKAEAEHAAAQALPKTDRQRHADAEAARLRAERDAPGRVDQDAEDQGRLAQSASAYSDAQMRQHQLTVARGSLEHARKFAARPEFAGREGFTPEAIARLEARVAELEAEHGAPAAPAKPESPPAPAKPAPTSLSWGWNQSAIRDRQHPVDVGEIRKPKDAPHVVVTKTRSQYFREDGLSFGLGDDRGWLHTASVRPATPEEVAHYEAQHDAPRKAHEAHQQATAALKEAADKLWGHARTNDAGGFRGAGEIRARMPSPIYTGYGVHEGDDKWGYTHRLTVREGDDAFNVSLEGMGDMGPVDHATPKTPESEALVVAYAAAVEATQQAHAARVSTPRPGAVMSPQAKVMQAEATKSAPTPETPGSSATPAAPTGPLPDAAGGLKPEHHARASALGLTLRESGDQVIIGGRGTFSHKDDRIKPHGGRFDGATKTWKVPKANIHKVLKALAAGSATMRKGIFSAALAALTKAAPADDTLLPGRLGSLLATLQAWRLWVHGAHHASSGPSAAAQHALVYGDAWMAASQEVDALAERAVTLTGDRGIADPQELAARAAEVMADYASPADGDPDALADEAARFNDDVCAELASAIGDLRDAGVLTPGLENLLSGFCDEHEQLAFGLGARGGAGDDESEDDMDDEDEVAKGAVPWGAVELPERLGARLWKAQETPRGLFGALLGGLSKGAGHRYIKRTGTPGHYRYFYTAHGGGGVDKHEHMVEGARFRTEGGHLHVEKVEGDTLHLRHDETGETSKMTRAELAEHLRGHHKAALERHAKERALPAHVRRLAPGSDARKRAEAAHHAARRAEEEGWQREGDRRDAARAREDVTRGIREVNREIGGNAGHYGDLYAAWLQSGSPPERKPWPSDQLDEKEVADIEAMMGNMAQAKTGREARAIASEARKRAEVEHRKRSAAEEDAADNERLIARHKAAAEKYAAEPKPKPSREMHANTKAKLEAMAATHEQNGTPAEGLHATDYHTERRIAAHVLRQAAAGHTDAEGMAHRAVSEVVRPDYSRGQYQPALLTAREAVVHAGTVDQHERHKASKAPPSADEKDPAKIVAWIERSEKAIAQTQGTTYARELETEVAGAKARLAELRGAAATPAAEPPAKPTAKPKPPQGPVSFGATPEGKAAYAALDARNAARRAEAERAAARPEPKGTGRSDNWRMDDIRASDVQIDSTPGGDVLATLRAPMGGTGTTHFAVGPHTTKTQIEDRMEDILSRVTHPVAREAYARGLTAALAERNKRFGTAVSHGTGTVTLDPAAIVEIARKKTDTAPAGPGATTPAGAREHSAKHIKDYGVTSGNRFSAFEVTYPDGTTRRHDVKIREGREGSALHTRASAKQAALNEAMRPTQKAGVFAGLLKSLDPLAKCDTATMPKLTDAEAKTVMLRRIDLRLRWAIESDPCCGPAPREPRTDEQIADDVTGDITDYVTFNAPALQGIRALGGLDQLREFVLARIPTVREKVAAQKAPTGPLAACFQATVQAVAG